MEMVGKICAKNYQANVAANSVHSLSGNLKKYLRIEPFSPVAF